MRRLFCRRLGRVREALAMGSLGGELQLVPEHGDERVGDLGMGIEHGWSFRGTGARTGRNHAPVAWEETGTT
jgi:hypothetical protein